MTMQFDDLRTFGVTYNKFTRDDLEFLYRQVDIIRNNFGSAVPANEELIGHIDHEYFLPDECKQQLERLVLPMVGAYLQEYPTYNRAKLSVLSHGVPIVLRDAWVNFQKKYEYNPVHDHGGCFSFVLWLNIPYTREDEDAVSFTQKLHKDALTSNGKFEFFYNDTLGGIYSHKLPIDPSYEGMILLFPSSMKHCVYPFYTSDDYRISVSGNFYLNTESGQSA